MHATRKSSPTSQIWPGPSYRDWVRESEKLAAEVAYRGAALDEAREPARAPVLPPDYVAVARETAERRLGQAGARLAGLIARLFDPAVAG